MNGSLCLGVHNMRAESNTSAARDAPVLFAFLEFHAGSQLRLRIRTLISVYPQESFSELSDQQILDSVAVEIADERCGVAYLRIDGLAGGLKPDRLGQLRRS